MQEVLPFLDLSFEELNNLCSTSFEYRKLCEDDRIWQNLYLKDYGSLGYQPVSWRLEYLLKRSGARLIHFSKIIGTSNIATTLSSSTVIKQIELVRDSLMVLTEDNRLYVCDLSQPDFPMIKFPDSVSDLYPQIDRYGDTMTVIAKHSENKLYRFQSADGTFEDIDLPDSLKSFVLNDEIITLDQQNRLIGFNINIKYTLPIINLFKVNNNYLLVRKEGDQEKADIIRWSNGRYISIPNNITNIISVKDKFVLTRIGQLYLITSSLVISLSEKMLQYDPNYATGWRPRFFSKLNDNFVIDGEGTAYSLINTTAVRNPTKISIPEPIIDSSDHYLLGKSGNVYHPLRDGNYNLILNSIDFHTDHLVAGRVYAVPQIFQEESPIHFIFWKNSEILTITQELAQLLLNSAGRFDGTVQLNEQKNQIIYRGRILQIAN